VRACVEAVKGHGEGVDVLLCNAGIMALPKLEKAHGYELQFFTNHVGHFLLVTGLLEALAPKGRVVMLSSEGHRMAPSGGIDFDNLDGAKGYSSWTAYGRSKLANVLFANALATRLKPGQTANSLHPGVIQTNLGRHMGLAQIVFPLVGWAFTKSIPQGAATQVWAATSPGLADTTGAYFSDVNLAKASQHGRDAALAERLWTKSEEIRDALGA
jgi:NAD(P)-dependent dehydrogenase (short-subunit alcohol dehydrogenase family)